jgi:hypothetical protein
VRLFLLYKIVSLIDYLVFLQPFFKQLLATLLEHWTGKFHRFQVIKFSIFYRMPKYCRIGDNLPGGVGACLKDSMTATVRLIH